MTDYLEVWIDDARERVRLEGERVTIGQSDTNDVPLPLDHTVSRVHAVLERVASSWCVRDLASRNGTFVNGERIWGERPLRSGDEIRVGGTRLIARVEDPDGREDATVGAETGPNLTRRERLANEAIRRGAVSTAEILGRPPRDAEG